mgnify:CR=1 FL=1
MDKDKSSANKHADPRIAGELTASAARKQLHDSLVPLHRLAAKHNFTHLTLLLEEAIRQTMKK